MSHLCLLESPFRMEPLGSLGFSGIASIYQVDLNQLSLQIPLEKQLVCNLKRSNCIIMDEKREQASFPEQIDCWLVFQHLSWLLIMGLTMLLLQGCVSSTPSQQVAVSNHQSSETTQQSNGKLNNSTQQPTIDTPHVILDSQILVKPAQVDVYATNSAKVVEPAQTQVTQPLSISGDKQIFTHSVTQILGGAQSQDEARLAGIRRAKREILEKAGTYLESISVVENGRLTRDEIIAVSAAIFKTEILSEEPIISGESFGLKISVRVEVDPSVLQQRILSLSSDEQWRQKLNTASLREQDLLKRIELLETRLLEANDEELSGEETTAIRAQYQDLREELDNNWNWFSPPPASTNSYRRPPPPPSRREYGGSRGRDRPPPRRQQYNNSRPSRGFERNARYGNQGRGLRRR
jgi:hypothetical protein